MDHKVPVAVPLLGAAFLQAASGWFYTGLQSGVWRSAWVWLVIALLQVFVLFLPALILLNRLGWMRRWSILLAGFIAGCLPYSVWAAGRLKGVPAPTALRIHVPDVLAFGLCGVLGAIMFAHISALLMRSNNRWRGP
jgi:hypothetical protein